MTMTVLTMKEAVWFLPFVLPIALWVMYTDLRYMKIRNTASLALFAVFVVVGFFVMPLPDLGWRLLHLVVVLIITFLMSAGSLIGAGDAKFAAAMAPYFYLQDASWVMFNFALILLVTFGLHRLVRRIPLIKRATPDWISWTHHQFPMGVALALLLILYLVKGALGGG